MFEPDEQGGQREQPGARGRQFQRQRQSLQPPVDLDDGARIILAQLELRFDRLRPLHEQCHGGHLRQCFLRRQVLSIGQCQRGHSELVFALDTQHGAAGHQQLELQAGREQAGELGRRREHLLEVVQQQHELLIVQEGFEALARQPLPTLVQAQRVGNGRYDLLGVADDREPDKTDVLVQLLL